MRTVVEGSKGRIPFIVFAVVVVAIVASISFFVARSYASPAQSFALPADSVVYDNNDQFIKLDSAGDVAPAWTGSYQLKTADDQSYDLGENAVAYCPDDLYAAVFGDGYQVFGDGSVEQISGYTKIVDLQHSAFYKLGDRKYLMVGSQISGADGHVETDDYLIVRIDKAGNAWLMNDEINIKTIAALTLESAELSFDVAGEQLSINTGGEPFVVDLKRISGSSNEYVPVPEEETDQGGTGGKAAEAEGSGSAGGEAGGGAGGGGTTVVPGGSGGSGGSASSSSGSVAGGTAGGAGGGAGDDAPDDPGAGEGPDEPEKSIAPSLVFTKVSSTATSISFNFSYYDPDGALSTVYASVARIINGEEGEAEQIILNKEAATKTIYNLDPNSVYRISLGYVGKDGEDHSGDFVKAQTQSISSSIAVPCYTAKKIYYTVHLDESYALDAVQVSLYCDGQKVASQDVAVARAMAGGWSASFDNPINPAEYEEDAGAPTLRLVFENAFYNGNRIDLTAQCTIKDNVVTQSVR